jgi:hypothetical protein
MNNVEREALNLMVVDKKSPEKTLEIMKGRGQQFTVENLNMLRVNYLKQLDTMEDSLINNLYKSTREWDRIYKIYKKIYKQESLKGKSFNALHALNEMKDMLKVSLRSLGKIKSGVESIRVERMQMINSPGGGSSGQESHIEWLGKMKPEITKDQDGKTLLIVTEPLPEVLDGLHSWKSRKNQS